MKWFSLLVKALRLALIGIAYQASAQTSPQNLAPNSQWEIWSGFQYGTQFNPQATGTESIVAASANTTGIFGTTTFTVTNTGDLSVGDLITASGSGCDIALLQSPMRITSLSVNLSITVRVPFGGKPVNSCAATLTPIGIGASWSLTNGGGGGPDGWGRYPTGSGTAPALWRDLLHGNYSVNAPSGVGAYAALGVKIQAVGTNLVYISYPIGDSRVANFTGKTIVFGVYGMQKIKGGTGTWTIFFQDNVNGMSTPCTTTAPSGVGIWAWQECSYMIPINATYLFAGMSLTGVTNDSYFFVDPVLTHGSYIGGVKNYVKPTEILIPRVHISPIGWVNASITQPTSACPNLGGYCFTHDPFAETGGQVSPTVVKIHGQLEGYDTGAVQTQTGIVRVMAWYDRSAAPEKSGSFLMQLPQSCSLNTATTTVDKGGVQNAATVLTSASLNCQAVKSFSFMDIPLNQFDLTADMQGTTIIQSGISADSWANISLEYDDFILQ